MIGFSEFLECLGGLHDANLPSVTMNAEGFLEIEIDDIFANFLGLPEYPGKTPARVRLAEVTDFAVSVPSIRQLKVYEWKAAPGKQGKTEMRIAIAPYGNIAAGFSRAAYPEHELSRLVRG
jgi:hypothetical protein